jgi:XTP/dITP diphosphohydrolase
MTLVFASTNPHKVQEIREILAAYGVEVRSASELAKPLPAPDESATTLEGNARLKASAYAKALGSACLADDSGLEVEALRGAPGVHSARYAGVEGSRFERDRANRDKLCRELAAIGALREEERRARLVCALCLVDAQGHVLFETRGTAEATIGLEPRGGNGFGYDALLYVPELGKTIAELPAEAWNARSHRGAATRALAAWLVTQSSAL